MEQLRQYQQAFRTNEEANSIKSIEVLQQPPDMIVTNPELFSTAKSWALETVYEFHRTLGVPDEVAQGNKTRRSEELDSFYQSIHGQNSKPLTQKEKEGKINHMGRILDNVSELWDSLKEDSKERVFNFINSGQEILVFDGGNLTD